MSVSKDVNVDLLRDASSSSFRSWAKCKRSLITTCVIAIPMISLAIGLMVTDNPGLICIICINGIFISMGILSCAYLQSDYGKIALMTIVAVLILDLNVVISIYVAYATGTNDYITIGCIIGLMVTIVLYPLFGIMMT